MNAKSSIMLENYLRGVAGVFWLNTYWQYCRDMRISQKIIYIHMCVCVCVCMCVFMYVWESWESMKTSIMSLLIYLWHLKHWVVNLVVASTNKPKEFSTNSVRSIIKGICNMWLKIRKVLKFWRSKTSVIYIWNHETIVISCIPPKLLCGNSRTWTYSMRLHVAGTNELKMCLISSI